MVYLFCYLISCVLAYLSFIVKKSDKCVSALLSGFAIVVPCLVAGARAPEIGTDVVVYVCRGLDDIELGSKGLFELLYDELFVDEHNGVLYTTILYFSSKLPASLFWALFFTELLCLAPVYIVIGKQDFSAGSKVLALFSYYCFFYHLSLNLMKQCIAISIMFWGLTLIRNNKKWRYVLLVALTTIFVHKTALLALLVLILYELSVNFIEIDLGKDLKIRITHEKSSDRRKKFLIFSVLMVIGVFALYTVRDIILALVKYKHSYSYQLSHMQQYTPKFSNLFIVFLLLLPVVILRTGKILYDHEVRFYTFSIVLSAILYQFCGVSPALYRISLYTYILVILAVPTFVDLFKGETKITAAVYYSGVLVMNFMFEVIMIKYAGVYPYALNTSLL